MTEDEILNENTEIVEDLSKKYIEEIQNLKKTMVSQEDYKKLQQERNNLFETLKNGGSLSTDDEQSKIDINELRSELFSDKNSLSNLEYVEKALQLREQVMADGGRDPFLPCGHNVVTTPEDEATANRVAEAFKACVDYADGDDVLFTNELQRITLDVSPMLRHKK